MVVTHNQKQRPFLLLQCLLVPVAFQVPGAVFYNSGNLWVNLKLTSTVPSRYWKHPGQCISWPVSSVSRKAIPESLTTSARMRCSLHSPLMKHAPWRCKRCSSCVRTTSAAILFKFDLIASSIYYVTSRVVVGYNNASAVSAAGKAEIHDVAARVDDNSNCKPSVACLSSVVTT